MSLLRLTDIAILFGDIWWLYLKEEQLYIVSQMSQIGFRKARSAKGTAMAIRQHFLEE